MVSGRNTDSRLQDLTNEISVTAQLPAGIKAEVHCTSLSRFGYVTESLNRTIVLADVNLSKSFLKEKLALGLSAVDLFHQRKHISFQMNGEGHTETVAKRFVPAYVLATLRYNWSHSPKKK